MKPAVKRIFVAAPSERWSRERGPDLRDPRNGKVLPNTIDFANALRVEALENFESRILIRSSKLQFLGP